ncbi:restriction endonuclease [Bacteroidia bacterium]|nr:restriction endonuclease [Bacteroidia bacterium]
MDYKNIIEHLHFLPKENAVGIFTKKYTGGYCIEINSEKELINYGDKIITENKTTINFAHDENWVVLECVNRLLEKGYKPENIILEKTWNAGHGTSGRLDICVTRDDGSEYLLIECKTFGKEFDKEFFRMKRDGGQLFTYFKFSNKADIIMLYASELKGNELIYRNEIVKIEDDYRTGDVKDFYEKWNKLTKDNGVFDAWVKLYNFESKALTPENLQEIKPEDSSFIFNQFLEILRHNVVSDKPNAFNKIFTLFLCKIYDEKFTKPNEELAFQWFYTPYRYAGISYSPDNNISFQKRLTDLYKNGMKAFLDKEVTDISDADFEKKYGNLSDEIRTKLMNDLTEVRLKKNNEFAIKEVFDDDSFEENAKVVKEVVELLQGYKIRYATKQQYLSDFFELLLTTGLKQESGQFFTPVPVAQFVIRSLPVDRLVSDKLQAGTKDEYLPHIIDYAAGSGHFVTESMHEIQRLLTNYDGNRLFGDAQRFVAKAKDFPYDWAFDYIYGIEKDYRLVKVGKVGCYLHGDGLAQVIHSDGLGNFTKNKDYKGILAKTNKDFPQENKQFDIVVSNPPYSVSSFKSNASKYYGKDDFELYNYLTENSSEIECLFVERTKQLLKDGGVAGIILPSSILSNTGIYTKTREIILQYFDIVAIAELGSNTFMATGTNTVVLFLRRRNNYDYANLKSSINNVFTTFQDVTLNGIEKPVQKYIDHVWEELTLEDYITLLKTYPNEKVKHHELYKEYDNKITAKTQVEKLQKIIDIEKEKLLYFILTYPQTTVLVKTGEKDAEKRFLGYEFSNRRGNEGIHPIQRGKTIDECTRLFDENSFVNDEKASTYIYDAFNNDFSREINEGLKENIFRVHLVDMLTFDRVNFEKNISPSVKKKVKIESKWEIVKLSNVIEIIGGGTPDTNNPEYWDGGIPWLSVVDFNNDNRFVYKTEKTITENGLKNSSAKYLNIGDVIISARGTVGALAQLKIPMTFNQSCYGLRGNEKLNNGFLYYILKAEIQQLKNGSYGSIFKAITTKTFDEIKIPLPPKEIQEKIVAEIVVLEKEEIEGKIKIEALQEKIDQIIETKFSQDYKLGDIISLEYGIALPDQNRIKGDYPVVGSNGIVGWHNNFLIEAPAIVVGRKGSAGKINWIDKNCTPIDTTFFVRTMDDVNYSLKILYYAIKMINLENLAGGTGVPGLNRNDAYAKDINLPPLSEQQKIVSEIEKIETQISELEQQLATIPKQKEEILKKYL